MAAAIDSIKLIQDAQGVHSLDVTVILGSNSDLSKLNRSYLCLFPLDEIKRPIPHFDWELIPAPMQCTCRIRISGACSSNGSTSSRCRANPLRCESHLQLMAMISGVTSLPIPQESTLCRMRSAQ